MAGSSTVRADLRLRATREDDLDYVVAAEAAPEAAPFLAPSPREEHGSFTSLVVMSLLRLHPGDRAVELRRLAVTEPGRG